MTNKFYITTAIPYVNAAPHVGFALELIQADAIARFHRLKGDDVFFLTGTDEHGMKLVQTAKEQGITPQELVDTNAEKYKGLKDMVNASFDYFIRTTSDDHKRGARKMWRKLVASGDIYKDSYDGLYCVGCEAFVLEKDLVDGKCSNHDKKPEKLKEENYFFKLSKYSEQIKKVIESDELKVVPKSRKHEILSFISEGLRDVSFSRPKSILTWGVEVPDDPDQVMYVWCDALSNYITAIGYEEETDQFKKYWPADIHVIGKDILRFHTAIWIGMLISAGLPLPKSVCIHGFITSEGKKMSKSLNNVVDPAEYVDKYGVDALRYFVLKEIPTVDDGDFSRERFKIVYESELANNIGNLVSRVLAMTGKYFDFMVPEGGEGSDEFNDMVGLLWKNYEKAIDSYDLKKALEKVAELAGFANKYVDEQQPWALAKENPDALPKVIYELLEMIRHLGLLLAPFTPESSGKILSLLGFDSSKFSYEELTKWGVMKPGTKVQKGEPLFARVEE